MMPAPVFKKIYFILNVIGASMYLQKCVYKNSQWNNIPNLQKRPRNRRFWNFYHLPVSSLKRKKYVKEIISRETILPLHLTNKKRSDLDRQQCSDTIAYSVLYCSLSHITLPFICDPMFRHYCVFCTILFTQSYYITFHMWPSMTKPTKTSQTKPTKTSQKKMS